MILAHCIKCGRTLKREPINGMGEKCARSMLGAKPKRILDRVKRDDRTLDLFAGVA